MPRYSQWERGRPPRAPIPSPPGPGDYISQHRSLRPRDGKKKKKKSLGQAFPECASCSRGAGGGRGGPGGAGRAGRAGGGVAGAWARTRPGPGPSMAEPLLRKTFSRLRGREKLPRKKSDAKERGEPGRRPRRGRRTPPRPGDGPGAPRRDGWGARGSPAESPAAPGGGPRVGRGPVRKGLGGGREGVRTVMCAWPGMPALRAPCEAREGASPLTGNGAETERLEGGGEELGSWRTGPVRPGWGHPAPWRPGMGDG